MRIHQNFISGCKDSFFLIKFYRLLHNFFYLYFSEMQAGKTSASIRLKEAL